MTQPMPFVYTDPDGDTLVIHPAGTGDHAVAFALDIPDGLGITIHVAANDIDTVVAAIYTAAGRKPPRLDPIQECTTCHAGYAVGQPCATCAFNARMAAERSL